MQSTTLLAFLKKALTDEGLRKELVALAARHGVQLETGELSEAALDQVAGGLLPVGATMLKTTLVAPGGAQYLKLDDVKGAINEYKEYKEYI